MFDWSGSAPVPPSPFGDLHECHDLQRGPE